MKRWFAVSALLVIVLASIWAVNSYSSAFVKSSASLKVTDSSDSGALISVTPVKKKLTVQIGVATEIFKIKNNMGHAITYTLESEKLSPPSGDLQPGEETVISINLDEESKPGAATFETHPPGQLERRFLPVDHNGTPGDKRGDRRREKTGFGKDGNPIVGEGAGSSSTGGKFPGRYR